MQPMRFKKDHMSMPCGLSAVSFWKSLDCPATQHLVQLDTTGYHCLSWQCQIRMCFHHPQSSHGSCQTFPFKEATSLPGLLYVVSLTDPDMQIEYQESSASPSYPHANHPPPYVKRRRKYSYPRKQCCDGSTRIQTGNSFVLSVWINNLFTFKHADALCRCIRL